MPPSLLTAAKRAATAHIPECHAVCECVQRSLVLDGTMWGLCRRRHMVRSSTRDSCTRGQSGGAERDGEVGRRRRRKEQPVHSSQEAAQNSGPPCTQAGRPLSLVPAWTIAHWELQARKDRQTDRQTGTRKTHIKTSQRRKEWSKALCHHTYTHGCSQGLKISEVWGGVKNCAIITPNTTHYIH